MARRSDPPQPLRNQLLLVEMHGQTDEHRRHGRQTEQHTLLADVGLSPRLSNR